MAAKEAGILKAIDELKDHFSLIDPTPLNDEKIGRKLAEILQVEGAAAWVIYNAQKSVHDKHMKGDCILQERRSVQ